MTRFACCSVAWRSAGWTRSNILRPTASSGCTQNAFKRRAHVDHLAVGIDDTDCVEQEIHNVLGRYSLHWRFPVLLTGCKPPQWSPSIACRVIQEMTPHFAGGIPSVSATHTCCEKDTPHQYFQKYLCYVFDSCWRFMNKGLEASFNVFCAPPQLPWDPAEWVDARFDG